MSEPWKTLSAVLGGWLIANVLFVLLWMWKRNR